jgi:predicted permease
MLAILNVVLPVFALMALGYTAVRFKLFPADGVKGLVQFVNNFATPCLLFKAMATSDFSSAFNWSVIVPFYVGALAAFGIGALVARRFFANPGPDAVSSGFAAMFTNTVLIGIPIVERAYGQTALTTAFSIIAFHASVLITVGMVSMELVRRGGASMRKTLATAGLRILSNPLLWGITLGALVNVAGITLIEPAEAFVTFMAAAVTPAALFGLGGALNAYKLSESWRQSLSMALLKLVLQPLIAWVLMVPILNVPHDLARYGVLLAAMPSGINAYVFATYYDRGVSVATNTLLISTVLAVFTVTGWLYILGL